MLDGQFAGRNDTFSLVADVEKNLVAVNLNDGALNDVTIVEVLHRRVDSGQEILSGANVVDGNLRDVRSGHIRCAPKRIEIEKRTISALPLKETPGQPGQIRFRRISPLAIS